MLLSSDLKPIFDLQSLVHYATLHSPDPNSFFHYVSTSSAEFVFRFHSIFTVSVTCLISDSNFQMLNSILRSKSASPTRILSQKEKLSLLRAQAHLNLQRKGGRWYSTKYRLKKAS